MRKFKHQAFDVAGPAFAPLNSVGNSTPGPFGIPPNLIFAAVRGGRGQGEDDGDGGGCKRILIVSEEKDVREKAKLYVENFMLGKNPLLAVKQGNDEKEDDKKVKVETFVNREEMQEYAKVNET